MKLVHSVRETRNSQCSGILVYYITDTFYVWDNGSQTVCLNLDIKIDFGDKNRCQWEKRLVDKFCSKEICLIQYFLNLTIFKNPFIKDHLLTFSF